MTTPRSTAERTPRLSIGLPVYNGQRYLSAALDSLLNQTFSNFELILSDNASTDSTPEICTHYATRDSRIRYLREPSNTGAVRNHNRTIELSRGEYFKWAAHDDICAPTFLERCIAHLDSNPATVLAFASSQYIDEDGTFLEKYQHPLDVANQNRGERFLAYAFASHVMVEDYGVIRRSVLNRTPLLGNYVWSDMVMFAELALHGPFYEVPETLFFRREHAKRAMQANRNAKSLSTWSDPRKSAGSIAPTWKVLAESIAALRRAPITTREKIALTFGTIKRGHWTGRLTGEAADFLRFSLRGR